MLKNRLIQAILLCLIVMVLTSLKATAGISSWGVFGSIILLPFIFKEYKPWNVFFGGIAGGVIAIVHGYVAGVLNFCSVDPLCGFGSIIFIVIAIAVTLAGVVVGIVGEIRKPNVTAPRPDSK